MRINKRFTKGISLGILISILFIIFYIYLNLNNYDIGRDEGYHLKIFDGTIDYGSIISILRARVPFTFFAKFLDYITFNIFETLTLLRISSIFFSLLIFSLFAVENLSFEKPLASIQKIYLYFPFLALFIVSLSGQRDSMLCLLTIGLYILDNNFQKGMILILISLLRPHMAIAHFGALLYAKFALKKPRIIFVFMPLIIGSIIAFLLVLYISRYFLFISINNFTFLSFLESFANVVSFGFIFVPDKEGLANSISTGRELLFLARFISPGLFIIPLLSIKNLISNKYFKNIELNKLSLCFTSYLIYTSFSTMFGFQSARQQLPYILALSFIYTKRTFSKNAY